MPKIQNPPSKEGTMTPTNTGKKAQSLRCIALPLGWPKRNSTLYRVVSASWFVCASGKKAQSLFFQSFSQSLGTKFCGCWSGDRNPQFSLLPFHSSSKDARSASSKPGMNARNRYVDNPICESTAAANL